MNHAKIIDVTYSKEEKWLAAIGYFGILCAAPLLMKRDSAFATHHGKQGLVLLVAWIALWVGNIVPVLGQLVWAIGSLVLFLTMLVGATNALNGKFWEMPVLGVYAKRIHF